jgi:ubiquinone biosynthesis protein COQ9
MSDPDFDTALVTAAFRIAADQGWRSVSVVAASRAAGLPVDEARARFLDRSSILLRFGRLADQAALKDAPSEGAIRDRLFDLLMGRFDALQAHRSGVKALLRALPTEPPTALLLACATRTSMRWMLQAAGVTATGPRSALQVRGLVAVWLWGVRAWERDESDDLSATMAAVDAALGRADRVASWLSRSVRTAPPPQPPAAAAGAGELDPSDPPAPSGSGSTPSSPPPLGASPSPSIPPRSTEPPEADTEA